GRGGRRRDRLRHRRHRRRGQGRGRRHPRGPEPDRHLPDRHREGEQGPGGSAGVHGPGPVGRGPAGPQGVRVPAAADHMTATARRRRRAATPRAGVPLLLLVPAGLAVAFLAIPLLGLLGRTPWGSIGAELTSPRVAEALRLSLVCSLGAVAVSVVLGVPLAFLLARVEFPGRNLVRALTT